MMRSAAGPFFIRVRKLTSGLRLIGADVAEFSWALDEPALPPRALLAVDALIPKVRDTDICHFGGSTLAPYGMRLTAAGETASFRKQTDGDRPGRTIALFAAPIIYALQK